MKFSTDGGDRRSPGSPVYLPAVARPDQLPVLYLLHGEPGGAGDLCNPSVGSSLSAVFSSGVPPFVVACPDGNDDNFDDTEWADSVDGRSQVETFVTGPLITAVEGGTSPAGPSGDSRVFLGRFGAARSLSGIRISRAGRDARRVLHDRRSGRGFRQRYCRRVRVQPDRPRRPCVPDALAAHRGHEGRSRLDCPRVRVVRRMLRAAWCHRRSAPYVRRVTTTNGPTHSYPP